ncbi:MAG: hypothetical protein AAGI38_13215, partial [Bacteroidota bacterium]
MKASEIQRYIAKGQIEKALDEMLKQPGNLETELTMQKGRLSDLKRQQRLGIISNSDARIQNNQILASLLELLKEWDPNGNGGISNGTTDGDSSASQTPGSTDTTKI